MPCLTINFQTKNVCIDGKAITLAGLRKGDFSAEYSPNYSQWSISLNSMHYLGEPSDLIYIRETEQGAAFSIFFHSSFEDHICKTVILKKIQKHLTPKLKIQSKTEIEILDTAWAKVHCLYHFRLGDIRLELTP